MFGFRPQRIAQDCPVSLLIVRKHQRWFTAAWGRRWPRRREATNSQARVFELAVRACTEKHRLSGLDSLTYF